MSYTVELTEEALEMLEEIQDRRVRAKIFDRIKQLSEEPEKQGKPLVNELAGFRIVCAVGQRYRIVYEIQREDQGPIFNSGLCPAGVTAPMTFPKPVKVLVEALTMATLRV